MYIYIHICVHAYSRMPMDTCVYIHHVYIRLVGISSTKQSLRVQRTPGEDSTSKSGSIDDKWVAENHNWDRDWAVAQHQISMQKLQFGGMSQFWNSPYFIHCVISRWLQLAINCNHGMACVLTCSKRTKKKQKCWQRGIHRKMHKNNSESPSEALFSSRLLNRKQEEISHGFCLTKSLQKLPAAFFWCPRNGLWSTRHAPTAAVWKAPLWVQRANDCGLDQSIGTWLGTQYDPIVCLKHKTL